MNDNPRLGDRALFPDLAALSYLNHCAISPPSALVRDAVMAAVADYAASGADAYGRMIAQRDRLRGLVAQLVGATAADIALIPNTTQGVIDIALCMPWRRGDRIICFEGEFPTNVTPWQRAAAQFGLDLVMLPLDGFDDGSGRGLARVEEELRWGVRLVAVSAVQFQTGLAMPLGALAELCRAYGAEIFVDAIQACGAVPLHELGPHLDYLVAGSHKWMMGLEGCAFLYVAPARVAALNPLIAGWLSHEEAFRFLFEGSGHLRYDRAIRARADFLETGAPNAIGLVSLEAGLGPILKIGVPNIYAHCNGLLDLLEPQLVARGFQSARASDHAARSCILSLRPPAGVDLAALQRALGQRGVAVATPDGYLRIGPHWPNNSHEVPIVLDAVDESLRALRA